MKVSLKNISNVSVSTNSYGKIYNIPAKKSLTIDHPHADRIAQELLQRYDFLKDVTPKGPVHVQTVTVPEQNKKGRIVYKEKKIVRKAKGVTKKI